MSRTHEPREFSCSSAETPEREQLAVRKLGPSRWNAIKRALGWRGNFIAGYRVYIEAWHKPSIGKYATFPADADTALQWLVGNGYLRPTRLAIQPERALFVGLIGYNAHYIKHTLPAAPVPGHYVDWDYEVLHDVDKHPPTWDE